MLSPRDDDEDDSHLCIKCNCTIVGLENYVKHRKERCGKLKPETSKDIPLDSLDPYSLGADVFFQSLELQSSVKKSALSRMTPPNPMTKTSLDVKTTLASTSRDLPRMSPIPSSMREDWIGGNPIRISGHEDNQTKLINAVASISGTAKKVIPSSTYSIAEYNDFKCDEDFDELDESEEDDEEETHPDDGKWKPSPNYTGGKWRPASPDNDEWEMRDEQEHTGGKWKLIMETNERDDDYDAPPPGHTKGKWVPGHDKTQIMQTTIQSKGTVQYWCGPCNRRLGSRAIYEKHLMSNLHMRKVLPEQELEFSGHLEPMRPVKRPSRPSRFTDNSIYVQTRKKAERQQKKKIAIKIKKQKRKRRLIFVHCSGCKSKVRLHLMGKHLISHYHFRKAHDIKSKAYQQLILDNIDAIVHQSPFQCSPCKFYTNWLSNFMQHWFSEDHESNTAALDGVFWCSFCKFECPTSQEMMDHMSGSDHTEVVAVINRSMPIIIRKKTVIQCETCGNVFRYNFELKRHCKKTGHALSYTATDDYQELHRCQFCNIKFKSSLTLAAHLKFKHKQTAFLCLVCSKTFKTSQEAKVHRFTSEHRIRRKEKLLEKGVPVKNLSRKCPYCTDDVVLKSILALKEHIRTTHPEIRKRCPKCGMSFVLFQEVSSHIKSNKCEYRGNYPPSSTIAWNCSQCLFSTDSQAECYYHEVMQHNPIPEEIVNKSSTEKLVEKYPCPLCPKAFSKRTLRQHLRLHTFERPYVCTTCGANFTAQSTLASHYRNTHGERILTSSPPKKVIVPVENSLKEDWKCKKCSKLFNNRSALSRHPCVSGHAGRECPHPGCGFVATGSTHLSKHKSTHGEDAKNHECNICLFKTNQASHMKRHMRCHLGVKPYACPHCEFICGSLENLRKHVLRSGRHPGKYLYHCQLCSHTTNTATDLRSHLTTAHAEAYDAKSAIQAVKVILLKENL